MKTQLLITVSTFAALSACSSSGGSDAGMSTDAGFTNITFTTVDIHPAAKAALTAAGVTVPSITSPSPAGGPYKLVIQGVAIVPGPSIQLSTLFTMPITTNGPYTFSLYNGDIVGSAPLGILAGISPSLPDGGSPATSGSGALPQLPCGLVEDAGVNAALTAVAGAGLADYFFPTGSQVGGKAQPPTADVTNAVAYGIPMSYASMLNCAGNPQKTTNDSDQGVAIIYASNGTTAATGTPVSGATFAIKGAANTPVVDYYAGGYSSTNTTSTDATGVATVVDIATGQLPPTLTATDAASDKFFSPGLATATNSFFSCFVFEQ